MFPNDWPSREFDRFQSIKVTAFEVYDLPSHHSDPFDRMIIAQAIVEEMIVLTSDRVFEKYPIDVVWCGK